MPKMGVESRCPKISTVAMERGYVSGSTTRRGDLGRVSVKLRTSRTLSLAQHWSRTRFKHTNPTTTTEHKCWMASAVAQDFSPGLSIVSLAVFLLDSTRSTIVLFDLFTSTHTFNSFCSLPRLGFLSYHVGLSPHALPNQRPCCVGFF